MLTKKKKTGSSGAKKLSAVILEYLFLSAAISVFTFFFLYSTSISIGDNYLAHRGFMLTDMQQVTFQLWVRSICIFASIFLFIVLFLSVLGQRLSYLITIIKGVEMLHARSMDYDIPLEGNDELTRLAESINYLSAARRELWRQETAFKEERDAWVRSLSHDFRTPLTSMLSYSELLREKEHLSEEEMKSYIELVFSKSSQIRQLTEQLMNQETWTWEKIDDIKLLAEQFAEEWEEILEGRFSCRTDLSGLTSFEGLADVHALHRILDNLISNVEKYADSGRDVELTFKNKDHRLVLIQRNGIKKSSFDKVESFRIGLESVRRIADLYSGEVSVSDAEDIFEIKISLNFPACL